MPRIEELPDLKHHKSEIERINQLRKKRKGILLLPGSPLNNIKATITPYKKSFKLEFQHNMFDPKGPQLNVGQYHKKVCFKYSKSTLKFESIYLYSQSFPGFKGSVDQFHSESYSKNKHYYHRLFIPLDREIKFFNTIEHVLFRSDLGYGSSNATKATINGATVSVCIVKSNYGSKDSEVFMVVESDRKCRQSEFDRLSHAAIVAVGYICGFYAGDQGYCFAYDKPEMNAHSHFYFSEFRNSIKSFYTPINSNPYSYLHRHEKQAKSLVGKLRELSLTEFSVLCQRLYDSNFFSSTLMLIIESSVASIRFMPGGYAIALESLSDIILGDNKPKLAPIKDKKLSKIIRKKCKEIIQEHGSELDTEDLSTLIGRIDHLNQPTNKSLLKAPFDLLEIKLLPQDEAILKVRNDLLHGRIPDIKKEGEDRSDRRQTMDLYYSAMRLYTLLNILILKWIGYDNRVLNHPKIQSHVSGIKLKEDFFRQV
ncbi:MAG: hypothetical protein MUC81_02450 [Bacteroidia bacterium]|jgi:hypothetical protein|nr:hypothetical protein [Bacteroidia bacterium]